LTDKAEARRAASAQPAFPTRRAREKAVPENVWILDYRCSVLHTAQRKCKLLPCRW